MATHFFFFPMSHYETLAGVDYVNQSSLLDTCSLHLPSVYLFLTA